MTIKNEKVTLSENFHGLKVQIVEERRKVSLIVQKTSRDVKDFLM